jgi:D-glycero-D-manno-heptose 1,7-bisphosphate phosphatase
VIIFFDRDGTLIENISRSDGTFGSIRKLSEFRYVEGVKQVFKDLAHLPIRKFLVTNQPDVGRNLISINFVNFVNSKIASELGLDGHYSCPHIKEDNCDCRKPKSGLLKRVLQTHTESNKIIVGDRESDIIAGQEIGAKGILLAREKTVYVGNFDYVVHNFKDIVSIVKEEIKND